MHRILLLLLAALAGVLDTIPVTSATREVSQSAPAATQQASPPAHVADLLRQLDDPDYAKREEAERQLFAAVIGDESLQDWIEHAAQSDPSPEVRTRLAIGIIILVNCKVTFCITGRQRPDLTHKIVIRQIRYFIMLVGQVGIYDFVDISNRCLIDAL